MQALYQKQGRSRQFGSKQERDAHIGDEIKQLERAAAVKRSSADDLCSHVQQLTSQLMDLSQVRQYGYNAHAHHQCLFRSLTPRRIEQFCRSGCCKISPRTLCRQSKEVNR